MPSKDKMKTLSKRAAKALKTGPIPWGKRHWAGVLDYAHHLHVTVAGTTAIIPPQIYPLSVKSDLFQSNLTALILSCHRCREKSTTRAHQSGRCRWCPRTQAPWQDFFCVQLYHGSSYLQVTIILCVYPILTLITHCINTLELTPSIKPLTLTGTSMRREHQGRNKKNRTFWISQKVKQPPSITPSFALPHTFSNTPNTPPHILFTTHTHISLTSSLTHSNITH